MSDKFWEKKNNQDDKTQKTTGQIRPFWITELANDISNSNGATKHHIN